MNYIKLIVSAIALTFLVNKVLYSQNYVSDVWRSDLGNGNYKNPVLHTDYSDLDVCRYGDDYYMTASSFNCIPGLPILHSKDMINWKLVNHAVTKLVPDDFFSRPQHGNGIWAPAIRVHQDEFYIYYGDPDFGIYMTKTKDPLGTWEPLTMVKEGKGLIDPCPLFDDDGRAYMVHAFAGSRAGIKSLVAVTELTPDGKKAIGESRIVYDGHEFDQTVEGTKFYKRNGYYYIFAPAGGVKTGWQIVLRSRNVYGPYDRRMVLHQGSTAINGPHQGAWVDTPDGKEDWFFHFQDKEAYGRIVHLQPMVWKNDWPVMGVDANGDGCGEPVLTHKKPRISVNQSIESPVESDEFTSSNLGLQWQWHANPQPWWAFLNPVGDGHLRLYSVPVPDGYKSLWDVPNLLMQKFPSNEFVATMKLKFNALNGEQERTGLVIMGRDYALLSLQKKGNGYVLSQNVCRNADKGGQETVNASVELKNPEVFLRVRVTDGGRCTFSYSLDGKRFMDLGEAFYARPGAWIGAKVGSFCSRFINNNDGGYAEIDWFRVSNIKSSGKK